MAVSGAIPEFFTNMISTFITDSGLGLGAVIGTLFFNTLGVAACAGIATRSPVQLLWYPLLRDCIIFGISVSMLTAMAWDGLITWYEGLILSLGYIVYWLVLFQNERIKRMVMHLKLDKWWCCVNSTYGERLLKMDLAAVRVIANSDLSIRRRRAFAGYCLWAKCTGADQGRGVAGGPQIQDERCAIDGLWGITQDEHSPAVLDHHCRSGGSV